MRTWGRNYPRHPDGSIIAGSTPTWVLVETAPDGNNDAVYLTTLCQCIQLFLNESPFFSQFGIPARDSVATQVFPDFYIWQLQRQFSPYFASLIMAKVPAASPSYRINVVTTSGRRIDFTLTV